MNANITAADFELSRVSNPGLSEIVRQRLYDFQLYPTAGVTQLSFFSQVVGQGITTAIGGTVGSPKTLWDTNLEMPGTLPSGKRFRLESIEVQFFPGSVATASTYTVAAIAQWAAVSAAALSAQLNDVNTFYQSGLFELNVLSKNYLRETPVIAFPPKTYFDITAAHASNSATTAQTSAIQGKVGGRPYYIDQGITLEPAANFECLIRYPAAVATPSGFNARVGVVLDGALMRASQ